MLASIYSDWSEPWLDDSRARGADLLPAASLFWYCSAANIFLCSRFFSIIMEFDLFGYMLTDTTGFAFTYIIAKIWFGCTVICYTHYPTISTDMLLRVQERRPTYNNDSRISQSVAASFLKLMYYKVRLISFVSLIL
jgi:hypothetical protein